MQGNVEHSNQHRQEITPADSGAGKGTTIRVEIDPATLRGKEYWEEVLASRRKAAGMEEIHRRIGDSEFSDPVKVTQYEDNKPKYTPKPRGKPEQPEGARLTVDPHGSWFRQSRAPNPNPDPIPEKAPEDTLTHGLFTAVQHQTTVGDRLVQEKQHNEQQKEGFFRGTYDYEHNQRVRPPAADTREHVELKPSAGRARSTTLTQDWFQAAPSSPRVSDRVVRE